MSDKNTIDLEPSTALDDLPVVGETTPANVPPKET